MPRRGVRTDNQHGTSESTGVANQRFSDILGSGGPEFMVCVRRASKDGKEYYALPDMAAMEELAK